MWVGGGVVCVCAWREKKRGRDGASLSLKICLWLFMDAALMRHEADCDLGERASNK